MKVKPLLFLLLASLFWAVPHVVGYLVVGHLSPVAITFFRLGISLLCFLPFFLRRDNLARFRALPRKIKVMLATSGMLFFGPHYMVYFFAMQFTLSTHVVVLANFSYIVAAVLSILILKEHAGWKSAAGILLSIVGVVFISWPDNAFIPEGYTPVGIIIGDLLVIAYDVLWGFYAVVNKQNLEQAGNVSSIVVVYLTASLVMFPFSLGDFPSLAGIGIVPVASLLVMSIFGSVLGYFFYNAGLKDFDGSKANIILLSSPVFGIVLAVLVNGDPLPPAFLVGTILVVISSLLTITEHGGVEKEKDEPAVLARIELE